MKINTCLTGDSLKWMKKQRPFADLIIADPPFNIGFEYDKYHDKRPRNDYLQWCQEWISECKRLLKDDGNILICSNDEYVSDIDIICRESSLTRANWLIWHYKFGQSGKLDTRKKFTLSKTHILRFIKNDNAFFDAPAVAVLSDRQKLYNDKRADPRGKCPNDVFTFKRIAGTHIERVKGIKTQMPVELLRIWIRALCKHNGIIFDPFPGSGASLIAAKLESRKFMGVELSSNYAKQIRSRLRNSNQAPDSLM